MDDRSESVTGTPDTIYDLASVLYHTLDAGASYDRYIRDAEEAGDRELAEFFRVLQDEDSRRADYAQELIALRTSTTGARTEDTPTTQREDTTSEEESRLSRVRQGSARGDEEEGPRSVESEREEPPEGRREEDRGLIDDVRDRLLGTDRSERS
jgi:rubrerythrin